MDGIGNSIFSPKNGVAREERKYRMGAMDLIIVHFGDLDSFAGGRGNLKSRQMAHAFGEAKILLFLFICFHFALRYTQLLHSSC